jgi:hypothetical protein
LLGRTANQSIWAISGRFKRPYPVVFQQNGKGLS